MRAIGAVLFLALWVSCAAAQAPTPTLDPERHMTVAEVKPGMRGYGLSVFSGTRIDRFDVEVISVLKNFNPKHDVVLIRPTGANLEKTGAIAGMSGSPVYLEDGTGRYRLLGAFAYGWPMMKEPLAGVQPIEYMLKMPLEGVRQAAPQASGERQGTWSVLSALTQSRQRLLEPAEPAPVTSLTKLSVPLAVSGMSDQALMAMGDLLSSRGLTPLQAGGGSSDEVVQLQPGSVMAVPLLAGDIEATALGTCTDVMDGVVYGFGHPFTGAGPVEMPMCAGRVNGVISNLVTSFKLGSAAGPIGTVLVDQSVGVAGRIGAVPATAPMRLCIRYADGSVEEEYRFRAIVHPELTPLLVGTATMGSLSASRELPHFNTVDFTLIVRFNDGHEIRITDRTANMGPMMMLAAVTATLSTASENPFQQTTVQSVEGEITVSEGASLAELRHLGVARRMYRPGEKVQLFANLRPFRGAATTKALEMPIPTDLPDGMYKIVVSDLSQYLSAEQSSSPHRFAASNVDEVFATLNEIGALRSDAIYLRLDHANPGVALGRTALEQLPSTHRQMLLSTGRSDVASYTPSLSVTVPSEFVISGSAEVEIEVRREQQAPRVSTIKTE